MAYIKNTWVGGDVVTASKLNNIENGIENANLTNFYPINITVDQTGIHLYNQTVEDVAQAARDGKILYMSIMGMINIFDVTLYSTGIEGRKIWISDEQGEPSLFQTLVIVSNDGTVEVIDSEYTGLVKNLDRQF